jgi:hypothetical protein
MVIVPSSNCLAINFMVLRPSYNRRHIISGIRLVALCVTYLLTVPAYQTPSSEKRFGVDQKIVVGSS